MTTITFLQYKSLSDGIYNTLMNTFDEEGNEMGMGEMGTCREEADRIIDEWLNKENIEIID